MKKREGLERMYDILDAMRGLGRSQNTRKLIIRANLTYSSYNNYISILINKGLIIKEGKVYLITRRGLDFMYKFRDLMIFLRGLEKNGL